jgi:hypothetical protein
MHIFISCAYFLIHTFYVFSLAFIYCVDKTLHDITHNQGISMGYKEAPKLAATSVLTDRQVVAVGPLNHIYYPLLITNQSKIIT